MRDSLDALRRFQLQFASKKRHKVLIENSENDDTLENDSELSTSLNLKSLYKGTEIVIHSVDETLITSIDGEQLDSIKCEALRCAFFDLFLGQ